MKQTGGFRQAKVPAEFRGDLAGSVVHEWKQADRCVSLVLVFAGGSAAIDVRMYWRRGVGRPIDAAAASDVSVRADEPLPDHRGLVERLTQHDHAVLEGHSLIRAGYDAWYLSEFPPRERIRPLMTQASIIEEMTLVDPSMLGGRWEGNGAWDNWATVDIYGGPLTDADANHACARPIATASAVVHGVMLPVSGLLMGASR
jgi:hypothetical protein